jgi:hypothetical protein
MIGKCPICQCLTNFLWLSPLMEEDEAFPACSSLHAERYLAQEGEEDGGFNNRVLLFGFSPFDDVVENRGAEGEEEGEDG